ncbi:sugar-binding transcriptional regulator [Liquorilactobacillus cacaonum]|uniref:Central glycolyticproteinregulator n=1 Tax=Liquorilactobacillus cacaonum DSM 21116 TaxID=1423729 RepID=A0A0R2CQ97_9LACO|nr:sugar-binding domain-containing protein [Liquorilactobacillus cacaonum]KRM90396.1 Central glycolyticproteinregulator [Liquorilactobacillus cacaonum DSM 21116]
MHQEFKWIEKIAPDMVETMVQRLMVLRYVFWMGPIGRRSLAQEFGLTERVLRTETDFLRMQGLLESTRSGMIITENGRDVLQGLRNLTDQLADIKHQEVELSKKLGIEKCMIVSGDSDQQFKIVDEMGQLVEGQLVSVLPEGKNVIAVMGGVTMATIAKALTKKVAENRELLFVPARGGVGESVDIQANTVSSQMAKHTGGQHKALYVPEQLSEDAFGPLLKEPAIQNVIELIRCSDAVIHGVGDAMKMANRRDMSESVIKMLRKNQAVGEAFGCFFDEHGKVVYRIPRIGLQLEDLANMKCVIAVAGGSSKAKAIAAYMKHAPKRTCLITDEGAANLILKE